MLSRHGSKQPSHPISSYDQSDENGQNQGQEDGDKICSFCQNELFTSELHESLLSSRNRGQQTNTLQYNRSTQDLYSSVRAECKWCQSLMSAILTAIHLDYWNDKWNGSHSDGSSMDEDSVDNDEEEAENEIDSSVSTKDSSHTDQDWPISLSDFDQNEGQILVKVNFIREDNLAEYSMIEVSIELLWQTLEKEGGRMFPDLRSDKVVELSFEVFDKRGGLGLVGHRSLLFRSFPGTSNLASGQNFDLARSWIQQCEQHEKCKVRKDDTALVHSIGQTLSRVPRHLIDVKHPSGPRVIVHQSLPQQAKYLALSYVWGTNQNYILTKSTIAEKFSGLDLSRLPKTILDAIETTQQLGYSYLWVDALCIVQDSEEPDGGEIAVMGRIYQNSEVTIIAASATSSKEGFFRASQPAAFLVSPFDIPLTVVAGTSEYISVGYRSYYKPFKDPINSRAWTLQERILSTRCLVYSYDGLKWGCGTCEKNPTGPPDAPPMFPRLITQEKPLEKESTTFTEDLRQSWLEIRTEYTSRKLTYGEDKLKAISAIAFEFSKDIGWTYLAGLWKEHLFLDLQWHRDPESRILRPGEDHSANLLYPRPRYRAPSWSWASIDSKVVDTIEGGDPRSEFHFRILSCDITYWNDPIPAKFHFEPVRFGILTVEARMLESNWKLAGPEDHTDIFLCDREGEQGTEYIYGEATLDAVEPGLHKGSKVYCLAVSVLVYDKRKRFPVEGILLVLADESETVGGDKSLSELESQKLFRRAGFFRIYDTSRFNSVDDQIISII